MNELMDEFGDELLYKSKTFLTSLFRGLQLIYPVQTYTIMENTQRTASFHKQTSPAYVSICQRRPKEGAVSII